MVQRVRLDQPAVSRPGAPAVAAPRGIGTVRADRRVGILVLLGLLTALSVIGWVVVVQEIDARQITDIGLISVVPPTAYAFVGVLGVAFMAGLRLRPVPQLLLATQVASLVFMLYGAPALFEEMPRFVTSWLHVGFVDVIARTGELFPTRDARFDWPGFFALFAFLSNATGADDLLPILPWVPVVQAILYLLPLYLIYRSATGDLRLVWLGMWIFVLVNWVGQDYFSPQGMNILLLLTIAAIVLTWFRRAPASRARITGWMARVPGLRSANALTLDPDGATDGGPQGRVTDRQQIGLVVIIALLFGTSVASHQLTPFAVIGGLLLMLIAGRLRLWGMPLLMFVLVSTWLVFMATTFLDGRLAALLADVGRPDQFAESNVAGRLRGSPGHVLVVQGRLVFTLLVWLLALVGGLRRLRAGRFDLSLALLAIAPFGLVLVQGYGGEMILRIFLFASPFMAFFAAAAFLPAAGSASLRLSAALVMATLVLVVGQLFTRYGNEKADLVTLEDYQAIAYVKTIAEPGAMIATPNSRIPMEYRRWEDHRYPDMFSFFRDTDDFTPSEMDDMLADLAERAEPGDPIYLILTRGTRSHAELNWGMTDAEWQARVDVLDAGLDILYQNRDATVYRWIVPAEAAP